MAPAIRPPKIWQIMLAVSRDGYRRSLRCAGDRQAVPAIADHQGPVYMRLLQAVRVPLVLDKYDYQFELGKAEAAGGRHRCADYLLRADDYARAGGG
ncbi:hypothetical protein LNP74_26235 [Klebsiella pneumoniae subsp. pneumoniae]|nr:hypothetical protein [Klebsiella pneumoniae subsp. pneumoniae]